jgi:hypothetical protein
MICCSFVFESLSIAAAASSAIVPARCAIAIASLALDEASCAVNVAEAMLVMSICICDLAIAACSAIRVARWRIC